MQTEQVNLVESLSPISVLHSLHMHITFHISNMNNKSQGIEPCPNYPIITTLYSNVPQVLADAKISLGSSWTVIYINHSPKLVCSSDCHTN